LVQNGPKKSRSVGQASADEFRQNAEKATDRARQSKKEKQALILADLPTCRHLALAEDRAAFS
jgi:hypothetical protein